LGAFHGAYCAGRFRAGLRYSYFLFGRVVGGWDVGVVREVIEDPLFQGWHVSQWVQMADLAAWSTSQGLLRHPGKDFSWD
jgi:hypothetical protein